jgi:hypothetical protein
VTLWIGSTLEGTGSSDANGNFSFMWAETAATTYTVKWERSSNTVADISKPITVSIVKISTALSLTRSASSILLGKTVTLRGELQQVPVSADRDIAGASVRLQRIIPGSSTMVSLVTKVTNGDGLYSYTYKPTKRGTWRFRAVYDGSSAFNGKTSVTVSVIVR